MAVAADACWSAAPRGGDAAVAQALTAPRTHTKPKPDRNARRRPFIFFVQDVGETAPAMPRLRKFDASNSSPNLPHVNGSRSAGMSTSRAHLRRTSAADTSAGAAGAAAPTCAARCAPVLTCRGMSRRRGPVGTRSRARSELGSAERPPVRPLVLQTRWRAAGPASGPDLAGPWLAARFSAPIGAGAASNSGGSMAVHTFDRARPTTSATTQRPFSRRPVSSVRPDFGPNEDCE